MLAVGEANVDCDNVIFLVNNVTYTDNMLTTLYVPVNQSIVVGCERCENNKKKSVPNWKYPNNTKISKCDSNTAVTVICSIKNGSINNLMLPPFTESVAGKYKCTDTILHIGILG